jgi:hypothetical protein
MKKILTCDYQIIPEKKLMLEYVEGIVTPGSLINLKKIEISNKDFNPLYNVIGDVSNSTFDIATSQIESFVNYLIQNKESFGINKTAIIFSTVNQKVYIDKLSSFKEHFPQQIQICTSLEQAIKWVERESDSEMIKIALEELQKNLRIKWEFESDF